MGERYREMVMPGRAVEIVGSPIYDNRILPLPLGQNILVVNQCFAKYGEVSNDVEYNFIAQVLKDAVRYGPVELRLHPHNDLKRYQTLTSPLIKVTQKQSLRQSLIDAGIVLLVNSTVILEALALGRPVLTLAWHPSPYEQPVGDVVKCCKNQRQMCWELENWKNTRQLFSVETDKLEQLIAARIRAQTAAELHGRIGNPREHVCTVGAGRQEG